MATIIRVKRRRNDDPLNSLVVSCKKQKRYSPEDSRELTNELKFAGTVSTKDEAISRKIKEAIRKEKLQREYKQHHVCVSEKSRHQQRETMKNARFKIVSKQRALDLANLDILHGKSDELREKKSEKTDERPDSCTSTSSCQNKEKSVNDNRTHVCHDKNTEMVSDSEVQVVHTSKSGDMTQTVHSEKDAGAKASDISADRSRKGETITSEKDSTSANRLGNDTYSSRPGDDNLCASMSERDDSCYHRTEKVFQLYDVEIEGRPLPTFESLMQESQSASGITCNSVPMVREVVSNGGQEEYVYDLYFTNNSDLHLRLLESSLSLDVLDYRSLQLNHEADNSEDEVYDDEDDENEETNWRNDYPDEDPQFYENDEGEYYYGDDVDPYRAFDGDDDGLADLMSARFHLEGENELSSPEEDLGYDQIMDPFLRSSSYSNYYKRVQQEMRELDSNMAQDS